MEEQGIAGQLAVTLRVNGKEHHLSVDPRMSLADVIRDRLRLTGLHIGCEQGACGACLVLIDGEPACSCLALAADVEGSEIETIEQLSHDGPSAGALERSFVQHRALQCGYCTPGFLVMGHYMLRNGLATDRETVAEQLHGNICRCTGYELIVDAILDVARKEAS